MPTDTPPADREEGYDSATRQAAQSMSVEGHCVRHLSCTLILVDEVVLCLHAQSVQDVAEVNQLADMPFDRIVPAVGPVISPAGRA